MRGRVRRADEAPPGPPVLAALRCRRCGQAGVAVVAMHFGERGAAEWTWCGPDCAARDGWPWLTGEQQRGKRHDAQSEGGGRQRPRGP